MLDHQKRLKGEPVAQLTGEEIALRTVDVKTLRAAARQWYEDKLRGRSVTNLVSGREIQFRSPNKAFSFSANPDKLRLFAALEPIIRHGEIRHSNPPKDVSVEPTTRAYHWLEALVSLSGAVVTVGVTIREDANGNLYYNHNPIKKAPASTRWRPPNKGGPGIEIGASEGKRNAAPQDVNLEVKNETHPSAKLRTKPFLRDHDASLNKTICRDAEETEKHT